MTGEFVSDLLKRAAAFLRSLLPTPRSRAPSPDPSGSEAEAQPSIGTTSAAQMSVSTETTAADDAEAANVWDRDPSDSRHYHHDIHNDHSDDNDCNGHADQVMANTENVSLPIEVTTQGGSAPDVGEQKAQQAIAHDIPNQCKQGAVGSAVFADISREAPEPLTQPQPRASETELNEQHGAAGDNVNEPSVATSQPENEPLDEVARAALPASPSLPVFPVTPDIEAIVEPLNQQKSAPAELVLGSRLQGNGQADKVGVGALQTHVGTQCDTGGSRNAVEADAIVAVEEVVVGAIPAIADVAIEPDSNAAPARRRQDESPAAAETSAAKPYRAGNDVGRSVAAIANGGAKSADGNGEALHETAASPAENVAAKDLLEQAVLETEADERLAAAADATAGFSEEDQSDDVTAPTADTTDNPPPVIQVASSSAPAPDTGAAALDLPDTIRRKPGKYRPRLGRARAQRTHATAPFSGADFQSLDADLQLLIGPADWGVELSALLRTPAGAAEEVAIEHGGMEIWLSQLDDELLEPLALTDASAAFGEPLLVTATDLPVRWRRTSRDLHVLGPDSRVSGFVSQPRVVIGQESVVICREILADAARAQILATGSTEPVRIEGPNVPDGWICWRGVRPARPSLPSGNQAIVDALDPLPAVSVEFSGGIQLSRGVWLEGYPPSIRLLGLLSESDPVLIDGQPATQDGEGVWAAQGWDKPGGHAVSHGGKSARYAIEARAGEWGWWPAWPGATHLAGALAAADGRVYFDVGYSGKLVGARPGQICGFTPSAFGIGVARPGFEPVWLLTAGSGRRRGGVLMIGPPLSPGAPIGSREAVESWVRAICSIGRAGAARSAERTVWSRYVAAARSQRKRRK